VFKVGTFHAAVQKLSLEYVPTLLIKAYCLGAVLTGFYILKSNLPEAALLAA